MSNREISYSTGNISSNVCENISLADVYRMYCLRVSFSDIGRFWREFSQLSTLSNSNQGCHSKSAKYEHLNKFDKIRNSYTIVFRKSQMELSLILVFYVRRRVNMIKQEIKFKVKQLTKFRH